MYYYLWTLEVTAAKKKDFQAEVLEVFYLNWLRRVLGLVKTTNDKILIIECSFYFSKILKSFIEKKNTSLKK